MPSRAASAPTYDRSDFAGRLRRGADALGIDLSATAVEGLLAYTDELLRWNRAYNLTAVRKPDEILARHLLDSLSVFPLVQGRVLDVGSGAGLPAVPLALAGANLAITAIDGNGKKARFLRHVQRQLPLTNLEVVEARVEDYRPPLPYDTIVSRAFASLREFFELTGHLLTASGQWVAMKGKLERAELDEVPGGVEIRETRRLRVPGLDEERHAVIAAPRE